MRLLVFLLFYWAQQAGLGHVNCYKRMISMNVKHDVNMRKCIYILISFDAEQKDGYPKFLYGQNGNGRMRSQ